MRTNHQRRNFLKTGTVVGVASLFGPVLASPLPEEKALEASATAVLEIIHKRRSVRQYRSDPVPAEHITLILDAARMAPTAGNQQPWKFLVIQDRTKLNELKAACLQQGIERIKKREKLSEEAFQEREQKLIQYYEKCFSAPVYIVVLVDTECQYPDYNKHDGALAAGNLMLAARALGYGTVYYTGSIPAEITQKVLNIPERYERICITPVGIPEKWPDTPPKKDLKELVVYEQF